MTRITYDTSVFLKGLLNPHASYSKLFQLPVDIELVLSEEVALEIFGALLQSSHLREVLPRLKALTEDDLAVFAADPHIQTTGDPGIDIDICSNPADNKYLVGALSLQCDCLVTAVPDLLALEGNSNWDDFLSTNQLSCHVLDVGTFTSMF